MQWGQAGVLMLLHECQAVSYALANGVAIHKCERLLHDVLDLVAFVQLHSAELGVLDGSDIFDALSLFSVVAVAHNDYFKY